MTGNFTILRFSRESSPVRLFLDQMEQPFQPFANMGADRTARVDKS